MVIEGGKRVRRNPEYPSQHFNEDSHPFYEIQIKNMYHGND